MTKKKVKVEAPVIDEEREAAKKSKQSWIDYVNKQGSA